MAKAFPDVAGWVRNKVGKWTYPRMPHVRISAAEPAAEADTEVPELSADENIYVRVRDKFSALFTGTAGTASGTGGIRMLLRAAAGIPTPVADGQDVNAWGSLAGALGTFLTQGLEFSQHSVTAWIQGAVIKGQWTKTLTLANTAYQLTPVSTPCLLLYVRAVESNAGIVKWGTNGVTTIGAGIPKISVGSGAILFVKDVSEAFFASNNATDKVEATAVGLPFP